MGDGKLFIKPYRLPARVIKPEVMSCATGGLGSRSRIVWFGLVGAGGVGVGRSGRVDWFLCIVRFDMRHWFLTGLRFGRIVWSASVPASAVRLHGSARSPRFGGSGVLGSGVLRFGVLRCGVLRTGVLLFGILRCGVLRFGILRCGVLRCDVLRCCVLWCSVLWCGVLEPVAGSPLSPSQEVGHKERLRPNLRHTEHSDQNNLKIQHN